MKIGSISKQTGLSTYTIRYYEKLGLIQHTQKDSSGHRSYSSNDIATLNWIVCMKKSGMPLKDIQLYTKAVYENDETQCRNLLEKHLQKLENQQKNLIHYIDVTRVKIEKYKNT